MQGTFPEDNSELYQVTENYLKTIFTKVSKNPTE